MTESPNPPQVTTTHVHVHSAPTNGMGTAAFVLSLLGWFTGGLLCPIGLILGCIAVKKEPRGLAIAGIVIGAIGSLALLMIALVFGTAILAMCGCGAFGLAGMSGAMELAERQAAAQPAADAIIAYYASNEELPDEATGDGLISGITYEGQSFRYEPGFGTDFTIEHPGDDGQWDTIDDWTTSWDAEAVSDNSWYLQDGAEPAEPDTDSGRDDFDIPDQE